LSPGEQKIDLLHVRDVVDAFVIAASRARPAGVEEFYLRAPERLRLRELVERFSRETGRVVSAEFGKRPYRAREVMEPWDEGEVLPGWSPRVGLGEGLREYMREAEDV